MTLLTKRPPLIRLTEQNVFFVSKRFVFFKLSFTDLEQMLVGEVVSGIDLKDKDMVDSGLSPSIRVDAQQEDELDQQEAAAIDPHQWPNVLQAEKYSTW